MTPVLYVEDNPDDVFFMQHAWKQASLPNLLITLGDGQKAMDYLAARGPYADRQQHPLPCLLLLDLKLPVKSGFDVLRWLRQNPQLNSIKAVIVSASDYEADIALVRSLGVLDYLVKPANPATLAEILRQRKSLWLG